MRGDETDELSAPARELVGLAVAELGEMSARARTEGFLELEARRHATLQRGRVLLAASVALSIAALVLFIRWPSPDKVKALSYAVEGGGIDPSGSIEPGGNAEPKLRFSDGTEIAFLSGARGQVKAVGEHDARIALHGKADIRVVPRRGSHWLFDAGPFLIAVTGTAFTAEWRDADERLEVALRKGSVSVTGPVSDEAITLRAGQRLVVSTRSKEISIVNIGPVAEARVPEAAASRSLPTVAPPPAASAPKPVASSWSEELRAGHFALVLGQAEKRGLDTVIAEVSSDELAALSDAARYSRRDDVARRALTAQRRRFPGSPRASEAAFLLGRLEETAGSSEVALDWYERCLTEAPSGTYTPEALGRKMTLVRRLYGDDRARPVAEEYLRRFGSGTYAAAARALIRSP